MRTLSDEDIAALADEILSRPDAFKKIRDACSGRFLHGMNLDKV